MLYAAFSRSDYPTASRAALVVASAILLYAGGVGARDGHVPDRPHYCALFGYPATGDCLEEDSSRLDEVRVKTNIQGKLCHPPESPYYSLLRNGSNVKYETLRKCRCKGYDLPDVMRRVCVAPPGSRKDALQAVRTEADSVKSFIQKTHLAVGLQVDVGPRYRTRPVVLLHTVLDSFPVRDAPELHSWVYGPYIALAPSINVDASEIQKAKEGSGGSQAGEVDDAASVGIGLLFSKRPSFGKRGFSIGVGYWRGGADGGLQAVISTNMTSFPGPWKMD